MEFIESGVPNLDFVLGGGLVAGSLTMLIGPPGSGKTIASQQLAFHAARQGSKVLVLTTLPEPHVKLLGNLRTLAFFDEGLIGERIELINIHRQLREDFAGAGAYILRLVRDQRANLLIVDSFDSVRDLAGSEIAVKELSYELSAGLGLLGVTVIVLSALNPRQTTHYAELTIADHIIMLHNETVGVRGVRALEVTKMRGAAQRGGRHSYAIDGDGMRVYPRQEAVPPPSEVALGGGRAPFGLAELDAMMGGGPTRGGTTVLAGNPGTGKTFLGLQFLLEGQRRGDRGLYVTFHETEQQLVAKAAGVGTDLPPLLGGGLEVVHRVAVEFDPDELAAVIRERVAGGVKRVVIDCLDDLLGGLLDRGRQLGFISSLTAHLRNAGVTSCYIQEISTAVAGEARPAAISFSAYSDNMVLLRQLEHKAEIHRIISVLKMRNSDHDRTIREFTVGPGGLTILTRDQSAGLLEALDRA